MVAGLLLVGGGPVADELDPVPAAAATAPVASADPAAPEPASIDPVFLELGARVRSAGFAAARPSLAELAAAGDGRAPFARTLLGLLAHAHDDPALAVEQLAAVAAAPALDDWRLYVLADSAAARGQPDAARQALLSLLDRHPDSPLRAGAIVRLAGLAWDERDAGEAAARIAQGRAERLPRERAVALEQLAWRMASSRADAAGLRESARRLLVLEPLEAARMHVVDAVAARGGGSDWRLWLDPEELVARADALLAVELPAGALTTLAAVAEPARGLDWRRLEGAALTASGRGAEAFARLAAAPAADPAARAVLDWECARAAAAVASSRAVRADAAASDLWRRLERERLLAVARAAEAAVELRRRALRRLAASYFDAGHEPEAIAAWRQLVALDPFDSTGARPLWERGWQAYRGGDPRRAVAVWSDLLALYPRSGFTRSGAYWTARALERLGEPTAARAQYEIVLAAHVSDFYARQTALRLTGANAAAPSAPEPGPWPQDPSLARARLLTDLGLDGLARAELDLVRAGAEPRAAAALAGLILARSGVTRESLRELKRAFPELGTAGQGTAPAEAIALYYPLDFRASIARAAAEQGLPAALVFGMVHQESGFDPSARSHAGACGLMQVMPSTGREMARKLGLPFSTLRLTDPDYSVRLGTTYFRRVLAMFGGNVELALAAYNGGPGRIARLWRAAGPDPELDGFLEGLTLEEPRDYVKRIVVLAEGYRSLYPDLG